MSVLLRPNGLTNILYICLSVTRVYLVKVEAKIKIHIPFHLILFPLLLVIFIAKTLSYNAVAVVAIMQMLRSTLHFVHRLINISKIDERFSPTSKGSVVLAYRYENK